MERNKKVSRRRFLEISALSATGAAIAACAQTPAPTAGSTSPPAAAPTTAPTIAPVPTEGRGGTLVIGYAQKTSYAHLLCRSSTPATLTLICAGGFQRPGAI